MADDYTDALQEREKSQEAKYKMDEELRFKAESRRNKLLGLWAGERMGLTTTECDAYAKEVVIADLEESGTGDVIRKLLKDFEKRNVKITEEEIQDQMDSLYPVALEQVSKEFPTALGNDHVKVGDN